MIQTITSFVAATAISASVLVTGAPANATGATANSAPATYQFPDKSEALRIADEISNLLLRRDLGRAAARAATVASGTPEAFKTAFAGAMNVGDGEYTDVVYSRAFGNSEQDVIYKLRFQKGVVFLRFLFHVENGKWKLYNFRLKDETGAPFPRDWTHIYPN